ncbi:MAG: hypothetical protein WCR52_17385 [Bacteroidota bacterium]
MKKILLPIFIVCALISFSACKQDGKTEAAAKTEGSAAKSAPTQADEHGTSASDAGANSIMKAALQGKWKPKSEPEGTEYTFTDKVLQRYVNGKLDFSSTVVYGTSCGLTCGSLDKRFRSAVGCLTIEGQANMCLLVQGFTTDRLDFVRVGDPNAQPETWVKQ